MGCAAEACTIFLSVSGGNNRRADDGKTDLPAVGVAAENKRDARVGDLLGIVRIVTENDGGAGFSPRSEGRGEVLFFLPKITNASDAQRLAVSNKVDPGVCHVTRACSSERAPARTGGPSVMIVVSEHAENSQRCAESGDFSKAGFYPLCPSVNVVPGECHDIWCLRIRETNG